MKDEIKEILEDIKRHLDYVEATKQASIRDNEIKVMYDYITNLQDKYKEADYDRHKLFEENQNLKQINEEHRKLNGELRAENKELLDENYPIEEQLEEALKYERIYKTRIDKAIEYIEFEQKYSIPYKEELIELLNILQGSDE